MKLVNRFLALLVALGLVAVAIILSMEVVAYRLGGGPLTVNWPATYRWAQHTGWNDSAVRLVCALLCLVGLLLVLAQVIPRRPRRLATDGGDSMIDAAYTRRGVARAIAGVVTDVGGIDKTRVKVRRRRVRVRATSFAREPTVASGLRNAVTDAAQARLDALRLRRPPRLAVRVTAKRR